MESRTPRLKIQTHQGNLSNPAERARILRQYGGIFPDNIIEYVEKVGKKHKKQVNYSR